MSIYVSVYIFALACFHLVQIRSDQVRSGQIWADLVVDLPEADL